MKNPAAHSFFSFPHSLLFLAASLAFFLIAFFYAGFLARWDNFNQLITGGMFFFLLTVICWLKLIYHAIKNRFQ